MACDALLDLITKSLRQNGSDLVDRALAARSARHQADNPSAAKALEFELAAETLRAHGTSFQNLGILLNHRGYLRFLEPCSLSR